MCSPPMVMGILCASIMSCITKTRRFVVSSVSLVVCRSPVSWIFVFSMSLPVRKLKVSMFKAASLIASGANLAPVLYVLVTSKGAPIIT